MAQMEIQWRAEASSGNWSVGASPCDEIGTGNSQWWYPDWGPNNARNAPNCFGIHRIGINNNHELVMSNNIAFVQINGVIFRTNANQARTINGDGIDLRFSTSGPKIENLSSAQHTLLPNWLFIIHRQK